MKRIVYTLTDQQRQLEFLAFPTMWAGHIDVVRIWTANGGWLAVPSGYLDECRSEHRGRLFQRFLDEENESESQYSHLIELRRPFDKAAYRNRRLWESNLATTYHTHKTMLSLDINGEEVVIRPAFPSEVTSVVAHELVKLGNGDISQYQHYNVDVIREMGVRGNVIVAHIPKSNRYVGVAILQELADIVHITNIIVDYRMRGHGIGKAIFRLAFAQARHRWSKPVVVLTNHGKMMKMCADEGFAPVTMMDIAVEDEFWNGCSLCSFNDVLARTERRYCLCNTLKFTPEVPATTTTIKKG